MNGLGLTFGLAIAAGSLALHSDTLVYWIGPAGCLILFPTLVIVLALPLLNLPWPAPVIRDAEASPLLPDDTPPAAHPATTAILGTLREAAQIHLSEELSADGTRRQSLTITRRYPGESPVIAAARRPSARRGTAAPLLSVERR